MERNKLLHVFAVVWLVCILLFSTLSFAEAAGNGNTTVYITKTGAKYHREHCSYLKSSIKIKLKDAVEGGYTPCSRCDPPKYIKSGNSSDAPEPTPTQIQKSEPQIVPPKNADKDNNQFVWITLFLFLTASYFIVPAAIKDRKKAREINSVKKVCHANEYIITDEEREVIEWLRDDRDEDIKAMVMDIVMERSERKRT